MPACSPQAVRSHRKLSVRDTEVPSRCSGQPGTSLEKRSDIQRLQNRLKNSQRQRKFSTRLAGGKLVITTNNAG
jgi:hypothetical protein